jgi:WD40 repeat protein
VKYAEKTPGDEQIVLWDLTSMRQTYSDFLSSSIVTSVSSDGALLATASQDGGIGVEDIRHSGNSFFSIPNGQAMNMVFSRDNQRLLINDSEGNLDLYDLPTKALAPVDMPQHKGDIFSATDIAFGADQRTIVAASVDAYATWPPGALARVVSCGCSPGEDSHSDIAPDGKTVRWVGRTNIQTQDVRSGRSVGSLQSRYRVGALYDLPDGNIVNLGFTQSKTSTDDVVEIFRPDGTPVSHQVLPKKQFGGFISDLCYTATGFVIILVKPLGSDEGHISVFQRV